MFRFQAAIIIMLTALRLMTAKHEGNCERAAHIYGLLAQRNIGLQE